MPIKPKQLITAGKKAFGKVKYYGPTMGKTTAVQINPSLIDFDDIVRVPSQQILQKYGFNTKYDMFKSGNEQALQEYQDMLVRHMTDFRYNPANAGKTLLVSQAPVINPEVTGFYFDNEPSIPSRKNFVRRNQLRGGSLWESEDWYDNLLKRNPQLKIDDRYVSEIEKTLTTLRRKISQGQWTKIIEDQGIVRPMNGEGKQLRFTSVKPRKADFYIETEVPVAETLFPETQLPDQFSNRTMSKRFKAVKGFRPSIYDPAVKVFRKTPQGYQLLNKDQLDNIDFLSFGVNRRPITTEKPIRLNSHLLHLPEYPIQTSEGSTVYLDEALSPYMERIKFPEKRVEVNGRLMEPLDRKLTSSTLQDFPSKPSLPTDVFSDFGGHYYGKWDNVIYPHGMTDGTEVEILKNKITTSNPPSWIAQSLINPAKKYYLENYNISTDALSDEEWGRLMQSLIEKNSDKEILFHATNTPFDKVLQSELNKKNQGYLGRGFYASDIPHTGYGSFIIPVTMPKGKQIVLFPQNGFIHSDNTQADKLLSTLRLPQVRKRGDKFIPEYNYGLWPGMIETSKSPDAWNQLIKDMDLNIVKARLNSGWFGSGYKYPEILIPEGKIDLIDMLFKAPDKLRKGGKFKNLFHKTIKANP